MNKRQPVLLVVDDDPINLIVIAEFLEGLGYRLENASSGEEAWEKLSSAADCYDAVLLDRMMPGIGGMEVLLRIKQDDQLKLLPVILQTAASAADEVAEGLSAGAFYYLTKPFDSKVLRAVIATALRNRAEYAAVARGVEDSRLRLNHIDEMCFSFRTLEGARQVAELLSDLCPSKPAAHMGLMELLLNAVEHGNLGITYAEKSLLIAEDRLDKEVLRRLDLPEYADRMVKVGLKREGGNLVFTIQDQGQGFDWGPYLDLGVERIMDNHGRGIAMARRLAFASLQYLGSGSCVEATIPDK